jgi:hypothetical protein
MQKGFFILVFARSDKANNNKLVFQTTKKIKQNGKNLHQ